jgi:hypothetical protein
MGRASNTLNHRLTLSQSLARSLALTPKRRSLRVLRHTHFLFRNLGWFERIATYHGRLS